MGYAVSDPNDRMQVLIADDHKMILDLISMYLNDVAGTDVTLASSFDEAASAMQQSGPFDVVLLDLNMPGMNGVTGLRRAIRLNEGKPVAILTGSPTPKMVDEIMHAGAAGIILKTTPLRSLANAIRFIQSGEIYLPMELMRTQYDARRTGQNGVLSEKESQVLGYLAEGKPNKAIASELQLAEPTVKMHVTAICRKLGAGNRTQAVILARDMGLA